MPMYHTLAELRKMLSEKDAPKMSFGWAPDRSSLAHRKDGKLRTLKGYEKAVATSKRRERSDEKDNAERGGTEYGSLFRRD